MADIIRVFQYRSSNRAGLIVQNGLGWGEIAPLPGHSKETLQDALKEVIDHFTIGAPIHLPSVRWGLKCAAEPYNNSPFSIPISAFKIPFPGCTHLKLKLGQIELTEGIKLTRLYVRKYRLRVDCNRAWSLEQALHFAKHFSPTDFDYIEEPVTNFNDLILFSKETRFPIAVDESYREGFPINEIPTLSAVVVKPMLSGYIPQFPSLPVVLSSSFESSLGLVHIGRNAPTNVFHGLHTFNEDLITPPLQAKNGRLIVSQHSIDIRKLCLIQSIR